MGKIKNLLWSTGNHWFNFYLIVFFFSIGIHVIEVDLAVALQYFTYSFKSPNLNLISLFTD